MAAQAASSGNRLLRQLGVGHPIVLAPMAGASTPELVAAVANKGGLGMFGAGTMPGQALSEVVKRTRALLQGPSAVFGVNLFVPAGFYVDRAQWTAAQAAAVDEASRRQAAAMSELSGPESAASLAAQHPPLEGCEANFSGQVDALVEQGVQVVSFHFGWPKPRDVEKLQAAGAFLIGNATNLEEAIALEKSGADAIIAQGWEAGGHRGTFLEAENFRSRAAISTVPLTQAIVEAVSVPVISAGGIMDGADVAAVLRAGACAAQLGTLFLVAEECATPGIHKEALLRPREAADEEAKPTVVTQGFTGKPARAIVNAWVLHMSDIESQLPNCFNGMPAGRVVATKAAQLERPDMTYMWAGEGYRRSRAKCGAGALMDALIAEMDHTASSMAESESQQAGLQHETVRASM